MRAVSPGASRSMRNESAIETSSGAFTPTAFVPSSAARPALSKMSPDLKPGSSTSKAWPGASEPEVSAYSLKKVLRVSSISASKKEMKETPASAAAPVLVKS
jgi:hypothetical protein